MSQSRITSVLIFLSFTLTLSAQSKCTEGDCINGYGTCVFPNNATYVGDFKDGKLHGKGMLKLPDGSRYIGNWVNQKREGKGRYTAPDGSEYFGFFKDNNFNGSGKMNYANKNVYNGEWANGLYEGQGELTLATGDYYKGTFRAGVRNGIGTMVYADGSRYEGEWANDKRHGRGTLYYRDGQRITGQWNEDQYLVEDWEQLAFVGDTSRLRNCNTIPCNGGIGKYQYNDGTKYVGSFENGKPHGNGSVFYLNGDRYDGGWQNDMPSGQGVMHYQNGQSIGAIWKQGQPVQQLFSSKRKNRQDVLVDRDPAVKIWAVVVGAARYHHMPTLRYTDDDAYQIYAFLKSPEGGALPDEQVRLLIDEDATRREILLAMRDVFLRADENDVVLFYFSGHGLQGAFLPVDYDGFGNRLEHQEIRDALKATRAKHKLVLADACHSGSLLAARGPVHITLRKYYEAFESSSGGTALLLSSKGEEYSLEDGGLRSGIFSHFLIQGLKGAADTNKNKIVTVQELFNHVHHEVRRYTGNVQTPTITGTYDRNMPVSVVRH